MNRDVPLTVMKHTFNENRTMSVYVVNDKLKISQNQVQLISLLPANILPFLREKPQKKSDHFPQFFAQYIESGAEIFYW